MDNEDNVIDLKRIAKMRNLRPYKGKTDDEIIGMLQEKRSEPKARIATAPKHRKTDSKFNEKLKILQEEFGVDMNNSNDVESLKNLVRLQIQLEAVTNDIDTIHAKETRSGIDYDNLKKLGDLQRVTMTSINDLGRDLGISRKQRKEKQVDDIPQFIDGILAKAKSAFDRKTIVVECPKCVVELGRYWLNFPNEDNDIQMSLTCWKCKEAVEHIG